METTPITLRPGFSTVKIAGLNDAQVVEARKQFGFNRLLYKKGNRFFDAVKSLFKEPMVLLLLATSGIYFVSGNTGDGFFLASAIILVSAISLYQDSRSRNAMEQLRNYTQAGCKVIRNSKTVSIRAEELVVGDSLVVEEGAAIMADAAIVQSNDFSVNESILTGESLSVYKDPEQSDHFIYQGTMVASGLAIATVTAIAHETRLGKIGKSLEAIPEEQTPLELQISSFVKKMVIAGVVIFLIVWAINYYRSALILDSLLKGLTLAMSILPEEIPVAFTTFMAIGAWRLMKMGVVVKQMKTVETLGSATVICTDKTGTITENKMSLAGVFALRSNRVADNVGLFDSNERELIRMAMWASEPVPFDPMEVALHHTYMQLFPTDERPFYHMIYGYPLGGKPPMMTHIFTDGSGRRIIAAKGAPEAIMQVCVLSEEEYQCTLAAIATFADDGYRVLGVGEAIFGEEEFPASQQEFRFTFKGVVAFYDPPKANIKKVLQTFYKAGLAVKIITGDNSATTASIARQIGFKGYDQCIDGTALMTQSDEELRKTVLQTNMFTRMFPEAKLKVVRALKTHSQIVAMTGDGVNDGPALKAAHIGIAMGKKGTEIAKQAAALVLVDDDLSKMTDAIAMGRRIYANLKKAIQYIISIHIPIILTVFIPLLLGWTYPNIFSPVHIIFLELIMGPTCSIVYENEPMEKNTMMQQPRAFTQTFFNGKELLTSAIQGLVIAAGTLGIYLFAVSRHFNETTTRTMVFSTLIVANILLTLVNRSFYYSLLTTIKYRNNLVPALLGITILVSGSLFYIHPLSTFFGFEPLGLVQLSISSVVGTLSVIWVEVLKPGKRAILLQSQIHH
ncbi:cation-translocating P-type ATPase [Mucilaginibacter sp. 22184]|uniref:cation-translocating P-type ATPase n=1 Tax=Mucilaginibacter sp. 22184 TaxID=3453887 RepID=UPI003F829984